MSDLTRKSSKLSVIFFDSLELRPYDGALMQNDTLPSQIDVRKLVVKGTQITAIVPVSSLPRFVDLLFDQSGSVEVDLQFYLDDQHICKVDGHLKTTVNVTCQRCLESMAITIESNFEQGIVWSEDDAKRLPSNMDPLIVGEQLVDLSDIVSEELILSFPYVSYHDEQDCQQSINTIFFDPEPGVGDKTNTTVRTDKKSNERENPFKVLEKLKHDRNY